MIAPENVLVFSEMEQLRFDKFITGKINGKKTVEFNIMFGKLCPFSLLKTSYMDFDGLKIH